MAEDTTKVYALDEGKNQHETMTREQIVTAIENMEATGSVGDVDDGFISKIKELNNNGLLRFWAGTMAEFNKLEKTEPGVLYLFTDDPTVDDLENAINAQAQEIDALQAKVDALGFKQGSVAYSGFSTPTVNRIEKQGKMALLNFAAHPTASISAAVLTIPPEFRPSQDCEVAVKGPDSTTVGQSGGESTLIVRTDKYGKATLRAADGVVDLSGCDFDGNGQQVGYEIEIVNAGWRIG